MHTIIFGQFTFIEADEPENQVAIIERIDGTMLKPADQAEDFAASMLDNGMAEAYLVLEVYQGIVINTKGEGLANNLYGALTSLIKELVEQNPKGLVKEVLIPALKGLEGEYMDMLVEGLSFGDYLYENLHYDRNKNTNPVGNVRKIPYL